ncbi:hypothetical protein [Clostridium pasteurianum]|uniref:hypothetical protein n=1 Tax=Clostridium pasteurianum TaxID=1501 RepID=UPI0003A51D7A|nr:hypothetical protein [Clostridium pasteurianum]
MNLTQWEFVFPLSLDELSRDVSLLSPALEKQTKQNLFCIWSLSQSTVEYYRG